MSKKISRPNSEFAGPIALPTHCPRIKCPQHIQTLRGFRVHGYYPRETYPGVLTRYRCKECQSTFSESAATLEYRCQRRGLNFLIFQKFKGGLPNAEIARTLDCSPRLVRERIKLLAKQGLLQQTLRMRDLKIHEPIAYDGAENFAGSQYEPNNIQQAIGSKSYFIYDFNLIVMNRKGRMSEKQKLKKSRIEEEKGCFPVDAIRTHTTNLLLRLLARCPERLHLLTDRHYLYRRSVQIDLKGHPIHHQTISATATRLFLHILFAVNNADLLLRNNVKAFTRETIAFSKTHTAMAQKYALFMVWKNFFRTIFVKSHKRDPSTNVETPAMRVGITNKVLSFNEFFDRRLTPRQVKLNDDWRMIFDDQNPCPREFHRAG